MYCAQVGMKFLTICYHFLVKSTLSLLLRLWCLPFEMPVHVTRLGLETRRPLHLDLSVPSPNLGVRNHDHGPGLKCTEFSCGAAYIQCKASHFYFSRYAAEIFQDELSAFFQSHFSPDATAHFGSSFLNPSGEDRVSAGNEYAEWDEEDELGYYDDGVKRTLTDEQIEIFRHSELETLRREAERGPRKKKKAAAGEATSDDDNDETLQGSRSAKAQNSNKKKGKKAAQRSKPEPKPDLRKRTWDVVEAGLDSLDYD